MLTVRNQNVKGPGGGSSTVTELLKRKCLQVRVSRRKNDVDLRRYWGCHSQRLVWII